MYYVSSYHLKENKATEYQKWLLSEEAKQLMGEIQQETGMRYVDTYWSILGFGEYEVEDWWELPNWAALDRLRESDATKKFVCAHLRIRGYRAQPTNPYGQVNPGCKDLQSGVSPGDEAVLSRSVNKTGP